jgi:glycosyltransferase involved in cell wall biosynthesis
MRVLRVYPAGNDPRHRQREHAIRRRGVDVGLVLPVAYGADWTGTPVEAEIPHWRVRLLNHTSIPLHLWWPRSIARAVAEFTPDIIDVHEEPFFPAGYQGVRTAGKIPTVIYTAQNLDKHLAAPIARMQRAVFRRVGAVYACSSGAADLVRSRGYLGSLEIIPLGVEDVLFDVRPTGDRVGYVGRLVPEKGVRDLLTYGSRLLCLGEGPLADEVRAAGGEVRRADGVEQLAEGLAEMAVLVAPSHTTRTWKEQFGRMVVEAMAAGVPVVAYASGSLPEVIGDAGLLVEEGDVSALTRGVDEARARTEELSERGRRRARSEYSWDRVAEKMVRMYDRVLASS